jgi:hypothetical protein
MSLRLGPPLAASAEALPEIIALLERVFPRERPWAPDVEWQYLRNPTGPARYVNAYGASGALIAHYAVAPTPPLADPPMAFQATYFSLNTAVDPAAQVPGLMVATGRALFRQLQLEGPTVILGVANENSFQGFVRVLGFRSLGRLALTMHAPFTRPHPPAARALANDPIHLRWRTARPGVSAFGEAGSGTVTTRLHHLGLPLDAVLSTGLPGASVAALGLPRPARWAPRLYAGFGGSAGGLPVPNRLRPSPLEYIVRVLGDASWTEAVSGYLAARRFEFLDFDVV